MCVCVCVFCHVKYGLCTSLSLLTHRTGVTYLLGQPIDACAVVDEYRAFGFVAVTINHLQSMPSIALALVKVGV